MKVLFLTTNWPSEHSPVDGIFVREHARAAAAHADVAVLHLERAAAARGLVDFVRVDGEEPPVWRVRYRRLGRPFSYVAFMAGALVAFRGLRRAGFEPGLIHAHSFLAALPALLLGRLYGKPVVCSEHWSIFMPENPRRLSPAQARAAHFALERADVVLSVSSAWADAVAAGGVEARVVVVPNVVDEKLFRPNGSGRGANPRLLLAGLLNDHAKGVDVLLQALASRSAHDGLRLDVVGDGEDRPELERLAAELGLADVVTFHGLRPKPELAEMMRKADLLVLPSRYENCPCVIIEGLACGLPVVATRVGGVPELVDERSGVLAAPGDPKDLSRAIGDALERLSSFDPEAISRRARERYGHEPIGRRLVEIYEELLSRG